MACERSTYKTGDGELSLLKAEYVDVSVRDRAVVDVETDAGEHLFFDRQLTVDASLPADTMLRRVFYYTTSADAKVATLLRTDEVKVLVPHAMDEVEEMKTDPVREPRAWMAKNRRYVNVELGVMVGRDVPEGTDPQLLMFVCERISSVGRGRAYITLYHDQSQVPQYFTQKTYLSIPKPDVDTVTLKINSYEGQKEWTLQ